MTSVLGVVTTVCIGWLIGTELAVWVFVNPVLRKLEEAAQAKAVSLFAARLGRAMPFWYGLSLLLLIAEAVAWHRGPSGSLLVIACVIWAAVILLTVLFLVPINNRMMKLGSEPFTQEAQRQHRRWDMLHRWRVVALCVAMVCFLLGSHCVSPGLPVWR